MSSKKRKGDDFRDLAKNALEKELKTTLESEQKLFIGNPGKEHAFDLASQDKSIVIECKNYTWTKTGRVGIEGVNHPSTYLSPPSLHSFSPFSLSLPLSFSLPRHFWCGFCCVAGVELCFFCASSGFRVHYGGCGLVLFYGR